MGSDQKSLPCGSIQSCTNSSAPKYYAAIPGDAKRVARCQILKFTTRNSAAKVGMILKKI